jgi:hypothetical protein
MNHRWLAMIPLGSALTAALTLVSPPPIRHVPRVVDVHFASRMQLCPEAPDSGGTGQVNDSQRTITEFLGTGLREIAVHQIGDSFPKFSVAQQHIREVMARRPQVFSRYSPWAEATPLAANGILATLLYTRGRSGRLEIAGTHLCFQDPTGTVWWVRVAPVDLWHRSAETTNQR